MKTNPKFAKTPRTEPVRKINGEGSGRHVKDVIPDDEKSVGKDLVEHGMREPTVAPLADDRRRK